MTIDEFMKVWNAHDGWKNVMFIIFDNNYRWFFDRKHYHPVYDIEKDSDGNILKKRLKKNDPKSFLKEDGSIDWEPIKNYLVINQSLGTLEMKTPFIGCTAEEINDPNIPFKNYVLEVHHVENVQFMGFRDKDNADSHVVYPTSMC